MIPKKHILLFILLLLLPQQLLAHAELIEATPAPGATLTEAPTEIWLTFNEPLGEGSDIFVFTEGFQYIDNIRVEVNAEQNTQLIAYLPPLPVNDYNVQWSAISADGHAISGTYTFRVAEASNNAPIFLLIGGGALLLLMSGVLLWVTMKKRQT